MKNLQLIIALLCISLVCFSQTKSITNESNEKEIEQHFAWVMNEVRTPESKNVLVAAHRGDWRNAPENSIKALENCINMGVDIVEIDLKKTKDNVLVLMHDKTIDRTMTGKGEPKEYMLDSLKKMTLKNSIGCPSNHRIPTFEEFMVVAKGKMFINIDKGYPYLIEVLEVLKKTGTINQVFVNGEGDYKKNKKDYDTLLSKIIFKPVVQLDMANSAAIVNEYINEMHPKVMELIFQSDTSRYLQNHDLLSSKKIKIWHNALWASLCAGHTDDMAVEQHNTKDSWEWIIKKGATIIQTDRPKELLEYLRTKNLHP